MSRVVVRVATCIPRQSYTLDAKLAWLDAALSAHPCELFLLPQEYVGGLYIMPTARHWSLDGLVEAFGAVAAKHGVHLGVGACVRRPVADGPGATEEYLYLDDEGRLLGSHRKYALPSYDDVRTKGAGELVPEVSYQRRLLPVALPKLDLLVGTVFCWEVFSLSLWAGYAFRGVNLVAHPVKFAPRGWLKLATDPESGVKGIVGFDQAPASDEWQSRLQLAARHEVLCPIAVSCNSWALGPKFMAWTGLLDPFIPARWLTEVPATAEAEAVVVTAIRPAYYTAVEHLHSAGAFAQHVGDLEGYQAWFPLKMHAKMRRLEAQLIGDTTRLDVALRDATARRQKPTTYRRARKLLERTGRL
jgi:predicted amidohydrolase